MRRKIFQNFKEMEELTDESVLKLKSNKLKRPTLNKDQEKFIQFSKQLLFFIFFLLGYLYSKGIRPRLTAFNVLRYGYLNNKTFISDGESPLKTKQG